MLKAYVINLDRQPQRLALFYRFADANQFVRLPAVDKNTLALISPPHFFFNSAKAKARIGREITLGEIACTLSHIKAWQYIAQNDSVADEEFVIIAEDDILLKAGFNDYIHAILRDCDCRHIDLVLLHKLGLYQTFDNRFDDNTLHMWQPAAVHHCDDDGSSLYLIKKSKAVALSKMLEECKPYWLADHFSSICDLNRIMIVTPSLGEIHEDSVSDLEAERNLARMQAGMR